jgi:hypothetical protein
MFPSAKRSIFAAVLPALLAIGLTSLPAPADQPPVYPGAVAATRPAGVGMKAPPPSAKTYATTDSFARVKAWYKSHLKGAIEAQQPGMEQTEDAFLFGSPQSGMAVLVQSYQGKTWIVIGPPT